jgi:tetratricopeptide (TPR) repeat protein
LRLNPQSFTAQTAVSRLHLAAGRRDAALTYAEQAVQTAPRDVAARVGLARALAADGQLDRATTELQRVMTSAADNAEAHALMGQILMARKDPAGARRAFERCVQLDPRNLEAMSGLVHLDVGAAHLTEAQQRVDAGLAQTPDDPSMLVLAARTHATGGDTTRAESLLKKAIATDPTFMDAYRVLGQLYIGQRKLDDALAEYRRIAERSPGNVMAETMMGMILQVQGKRAEAMRVYEAIVAREPRAVVASNNLAFMFAEDGMNLDRALSLAQAAKAQLPEEPDVNDTLGWIYYKKDLASLAVGPLEQSVAKEPSNADFQYHLGLAYLKVGKQTNGRAALDRALKLDPRSEMATEARRALGER